MPAKSHTICLLAILVSLITFPLRAASVAVVAATRSLSDPKERGYAQNLNARLSRWLDDMGVAHDMLDDDDVIAGRLDTYRSAIFGYNPQPTLREQQAALAFRDRGGKLIVFYGAAPEWATALGLRVGRYMAATAEQQWASLRFVDQAAPAGAPLIVRQHSTSLRPVYPSARTSRTLAWWHDPAGNQTAEPAIVAFRGGFWITHVLLDEGDTAAKKQLLLAMLADQTPALWGEAARANLYQSPLGGQAGGVVGAIPVVEALAVDTGAKTARFLKSARLQIAEAEAALTRGEGLEAWQLTHDAKSDLFLAAGRTLPPRDGERIGVWDHAGTGLTPGAWEQTASQLARQGVTDLFINLLWSGAAHYPSAVVPRSRTFDWFGDQAEASVAAAHAAGMRAHAWKVCWKLQGAPPETIEAYRKAGRLQENPDGQSVPWLCPSRADNIRMEVAAMVEVAQRYPVDGIHLDYIRYRDSNGCCCQGCRLRFEAALGRRTRLWPPPLGADPTRKLYDTWRRGRITHLVRQTSEALRRIRPGISLSAAVYGKYPACRASVAQDWVQWLDEGVIDFVCPMNYTDDLGRFNQWIREQSAHGVPANRIWPGIGVKATESRLDPIQVVQQIRAMRRQQMGGVVLFDLNYELAEQLLPALSLGQPIRGRSR